MHVNNRLLIPLEILLLYKVNVVTGKGENAKLIQDLLKNYSRDARPFENNSSPVFVKFSMYYQQLQELNEPLQVAKSLIWTRTYWTDVNLKWNPNEYGGQTHIHVSSSKIWIPDLTLFNIADGTNGAMYDLSYQARVQSNGNVSLSAPLLLQSVCQMDIKNFPFDTQKCNLKIGSWTYDSLDVDFRQAPPTNGIIMDRLEPNSIWEFKSVKVVHRSTMYACCKHPFHDITYTFEFQRKSSYYVMTIIIPSIMLSVLSCISFLFPPDSGERTSLGISVVLGILVFMIIVNERTPVTSDGAPMLTVFFICIQISTFLSIIATGLILRLNYGHLIKPVPRSLALIRDFFARVLRMENTKKYSTETAATSFGGPNLGDNKTTEDVSPTAHSETIKHFQAEKISQEPQRIAIDLNDESNDDKLKKEWKFTMQVFDRSFFTFFLMISFALALAIFAFWLNGL